MHHKVAIGASGSNGCPFEQDRARLGGQVVTRLAHKHASAITEEHPACAGVLENPLPDVDGRFQLAGALNNDNESPSGNGHQLPGRAEGDGWVDWSGLATLLVELGLAGATALERLLRLSGHLRRNPASD